MNRASFGGYLFSLRSALCARLTTVSLFVVLAVGLSLPAVGQTSANGAMRGYVKDPTGAVLPEAKVTVASPTAPTPFTVVSDMEGYYRLLELPPGEYELTAERPSFAKYVRRGIVIRAGLNLAVDIDLVLGGRTETTMVTAETCVVGPGEHVVHLRRKLQVALYGV